MAKKPIMSKWNGTNSHWAELTTSFIMQRANTLHFLIDQNSRSFFFKFCEQGMKKKSELSGLTPNMWAISTVTYPVKIEHGWNLWLKVSFIICRYTTIFFETPPCEKPFSEFVVYLLHIINESLSHKFHPHSILTR